jgi:hypothetical protein
MPQIAPPHKPDRYNSAHASPDEVKIFLVLAAGESVNYFNVLLRNCIVVLIFWCLVTLLLPVTSTLSKRDQRAQTRSQQRTNH